MTPKAKDELDGLIASIIHPWLSPPSFLDSAYMRFAVELRQRLADAGVQMIALRPTVTTYDPHESPFYTEPSKS